jgi:hypothetical protein
VTTLGLASALAGCGEVDDTVIETQSSAITWRRYSWEQGQPAVNMGSGADRVCFLTGVHGSFRGGGEAVRVLNANGTWLLTGSSQQSGVGGTAACVSQAPLTQPVFPGRYSLEYVWRQGNAPVNMGSTNGRVCFLTGMSGKFEGGGEMIRTRVSNGSWFLDGTSSQAGVAAWAYCLGGVPYTVEKSYDQTQGSGTFLFSDPKMDAAVCALTRVQGKFRGATESVAVDFHPDIPQIAGWYMYVHSNQAGVGMGARCIFQ